ncbi:MAG: hypothetical protein WA347_01990 [Rhabdochlamydiaceae bacterium]|jgi:hypothetical protein
MFGKSLLMFIFLVVCTFASGNSSIYTGGYEAPSIIQIITKHAEAIEHYDGEKLYLKSEKIHHTNYGPVLYNSYSAVELASAQEKPMPIHRSFIFDFDYA